MDNNGQQKPGVRLQRAFNKIASVTATLGVFPYNAGLWAQRADILVRIGYPELSAGDARKAQKLLEAMKNRETGAFCVQARKQFIDECADAPGVPSPMPAGLLYNQYFWDHCVKEVHFKNFQTIASALNQTEDWYNLREMCKEARSLYPKNVIFPAALHASTANFRTTWQYIQQAVGSEEANQRAKFGSLNFRQYPFMAPEYLKRSAALIESANSRLREMGAPCTINYSIIGRRTQQSTPLTLSKTLTWKSVAEFVGWNSQSGTSDIQKGEPDTLGVFATSDIQEGDVIFTDSTPWGSTSIPAISKVTVAGRTYPGFRCENCCGMTNIWHRVIHQAECCTTNYCSRRCLEEAKATYHKAICGRDFSWLMNSQKNEATPVHTFDLDRRMWLRILAICVQSGLHPLDHPLIAGLTPNYESGEDVSRRWSLETHVDVPQRILTTLGVDVFKDMRYDTWVLQTIWARMKNNAHGGVSEGYNGPVATEHVNSLYSFINHSCEPNAEAKDVFSTFTPCSAPVFGSTTLAIIAKKSIKQGEEIFVSYIGEKTEETRKQRNEALRNWLSEECQCTKCRREA